MMAPLEVRNDKKSSPLIANGANLMNITSIKKGGKVINGVLSI